MFRIMHNECRIRFRLSANGPVFIRSGEKLELDPVLPDDQFIRSCYDGEETAVIPGSSMKGVFRSRAEKLLGGCCKVFYSDRRAPDYNDYCYNRLKGKPSAKDKYTVICPACKIFGNPGMKSRIEFKDAFPEKGSVSFATRHNVGIDRVSGSARQGALFEPEILESGSFNVEIIMRNFFRWQLKTILQIIDDVNEGYVSFGGSTSRGFGRMKAGGVQIEIREYGIRNSEQDEFFAKRQFTLEELGERLKDVSLCETEFTRVKYDERI